MITQPQRSRAEKAHAHDLADIIAEITSITILTANLPDDSALQKEHEVEVFSNAGTGEHVLVEVFRFVRNQIRLCRALHSRDEEIVLFFGTTSYLLPVLFARYTGRTIVVLPRGNVPLSLKLRWENTLPSTLANSLAGLVSLLEHLNYRTADAVITYTPSMARQLDLIRYNTKLYTNGARFVDIHKFDIEIPFGNRETNVGFIGRLDVEKRVPELAKTARRLPDDIHFVFVGDGDYREQLEQELASEIDSGVVEFVGWVDRDAVPTQLNRLQLLVAPSHPTEGLPTAILESMACGTPAFATPVSGVPDVVRDGDTGFLIEEVNEQRMATAIEEILERDDLDKISENARRLIEEEYSFDAAVERYTEILSDITCA